MDLPNVIRAGFLPIRPAPDAGAAAAGHLLCGHVLRLGARFEKSTSVCHLDGGPGFSFFGGMSIAYSQVGVCHALSYGLSFVLGVHHGIGNSIVFDYLDEFYPEGVAEFRRMLTRQQIELPRGVVADATDAQIDKMVDVALILVPLWENALGQQWAQIMTRDRIRELYKKM